MNWTKPWGTPLLTGMYSDVLLLILTQLQVVQQMNQYNGYAWDGNENDLEMKQWCQ